LTSTYSELIEVCTLKHSRPDSNSSLGLLTGGDPEKVRASQRKRFADETLVDQIIEMDAITRKGKF